MLAYLRIKDFALIQSLEMELGPGLTVLTGETGAGKSIILAAVGLLLGQRANSDLIRQGADAAVVEAAFSLEAGSPVGARLAEEGIWNPADGEDLVLRRTVSRQGRNRVQVGGALAALGLLAQLGPELLSLCGQHAHQDLLRVDEHLLLLDAFAGLEDRRDRVGALVKTVRDLDRRLKRLERETAERRARRDLLEHTVDELNRAGLEEGEMERLLAERKLLANAEKAARLADGAHQGLFASEEGSALETLGRVRGLMADLQGLDERAAELAARVEEAYFLLEDAAAELRDYASRLVFDPARLDQVESRLLTIQRLARKHGGDEAAALRALEAAQAELDALDEGGRRLGDLSAERARALEAALAAAGELSKLRSRAARELARAAEGELGELGLADCRFEVRLNPPGGGALDTPQGPLADRGLEAAEFYIAPNPGEGLRPLNRIASGGELSRILLALKGVTARRRGAPTQVFDEVDAGIGGAVGAAVGRKLAALAQGRQVICITHLPQIAAFGDRHFSVEKHAAEGRTVTVLRRLDREGRLDELARMLTGAEQGGTARRHARELMAAARKKKSG